MGGLTIAIPPMIYMPGRDSIEGVVQLVNVPEPIQGKTLTVRLQAFRKVTQTNREGRTVHSNRQEYNYEQPLGGTQQYTNNQQFRFVLPVPVLERQFSQGQDPTTTMGTILGAVDSVRAVFREPLKWRVTASLSIPYSVGLGKQASVVVAEPGQAVPTRPTTTRPGSFAARQAATGSLPNATNAEGGLVPANGKLCNICYMEDHDPNVLAVACDNGHYLCQPCFASWVQSQSDIDSNPQKIILNGGKVHCVCKQSSNCNSGAFGNKLIAMATSEEIYEQYLRARDFVVGKDAVAGALSKLSVGGVDAIEQEQIRNMYRKGDGSFSTYMCGQCQFGPIDHGWCNNLATHHGEEKQNGRSVVNNACPKCGWFAEDISVWPRWDGSFQAQGPS